MQAKKIKRFAGRQLLRSIGKFLYFVGLTTLIPFLPALLVSPVSLNNFFNKATGACIFLFSIGGLLIFVGTGSVKKTLRTLGIATILPAALAFIFSLFGKQFIMSLLSSLNISAEYVLPWVDKYVPSVLTVAIVYVVIGAVLIATSLFFRD